MWSHSSIAVLCVFLAASLCTGCITRSVRESVFAKGQTEVYLRGDVKGGTAVDRQYQHPIPIAAVRIAHILSRLDMRKSRGESGEREPVIPIENLYTIADGVSKALDEADSSQVVAVTSILRTKRWGIFDRNYLTSFVTYVKDDLLYIHLARVNWEIPPSKDKRIPQPYIGNQSSYFRLIPTEAMTLVDPQSVSIEWRDPIFKRPTRTRITAGGRVMRREILMESPEEDTTVFEPEPRVTENLSPQTLRDLADLEEARQKGQLTESQFNALRRQILAADPGSR